MSITIEGLHLSQVAQIQAYLHPSALAVLTAEPAPLLYSASINGQPCGALVATVEEDEAVLHSLFVDADHRRQGVGTALLSALRQHLEAEEVEELFTQWVLPETSCQEVEGFLERQSFTCQREETPIFRIYSGDLSTSPMLRGAFSPSYKVDANIIPVSQWTEAQWAEVNADSTIDPLLRVEPFRGEMWEEVSAGYRYGGKIVAYLLLKQAGEGEIALLPAVARKGAHPAAMLQLLAAALNKCRRYYQGDFSIWTNTITDHSRMLVERLAMGKAVPWWSGEGELSLKGSVLNGGKSQFSLLRGDVTAVTERWERNDLGSPSGRAVSVAD